MAGMEALRRQLSGIDDMRAVVRAMKTLSAVRIRQCRDASAALHSFSATLDLGMQAALRARPSRVCVSPAPRDTRALILVFGSEAGLVGGYNARIADAAIARERALGANRAGMIAVGARVSRWLDRAGAKVVARRAAPRTLGDVERVVDGLLPTLDEWRTRAGIERWILCYTADTPGRGLVLRAEPLAQLDAETLVALRSAPWPTRQLPTVRGRWEDALSALVRHRMHAGLTLAVIQALASEHVSRLSAMQAAADRLDAMRTEIARTYREAVQESTTEELHEIIAGFAVLDARERRRRNPRERR